jgi:hypothetical protein
MKNRSSEEVRRDLREVGGGDDDDAGGGDDVGAGREGRDGVGEVEGVGIDVDGDAEVEVGTTGIGT